MLRLEFQPKPSKCVLSNKHRRITLDVSVIIPTHNPDPGRLNRTIDGLRKQQISHPLRWEVILVDNACDTAVEVPEDESRLEIRVIREPVLGLTSARSAGFRAAQGALLVMVDDDNVLAPSYIDEAYRLAEELPNCGAFGGKSVAEYEVPPPAWLSEFEGLLAIRDLGDQPITSPASIESGYPEHSPIGAGMIVRRSAIESWLVESENSTLTDRKGSKLTSSGDNDIVLHILKSGWQVSYQPSLRLIHLIPASRIQVEYLSRLNRGIQESWMRVLSQHGINPWPQLSPLGARLRCLRSVWTNKPWKSAPARIRHAGACGHFTGRVKQFA